MLRDPIVSINRKGMILRVVLSTLNKHLGSTVCGYGFDKRQITQGHAAW